MSRTDMEDVESFRHRARAWLKDNMPPVPTDLGGVIGLLSDEEELADVQRNRELQRRLFDGGFAGICFPREYGGQGLSPAHQRAFNEELAGYDYPARLQLPTFSPCAPVILEFGTHEQKLAHIPGILKGDEIWMQFLSEPSGGSDVAGAQTTAVRDGDEWVLNGSKIWTTGAWWSDWGLCLARTNWDVEKHRGLSVFMVKIRQPGIEIHRIEMLDGSKEFCQEFMTDVRVPDHDRIGDVDEGWTVGVRWMFHEKMLANSPWVTLPAATPRGARTVEVRDLIRAARRNGRLGDDRTRELIGESYSLDVVRRELLRRVADGIALGKTTEHSAAIGRLFSGVTAARQTTIAFELGGAEVVAWTDAEAASGERGTGYLMRQASCIAGGTTEMARNVVSERVLGMPRERTGDRDIPFREVPRGPTHAR